MLNYLELCFVKILIKSFYSSLQFRGGKKERKPLANFPGLKLRGKARSLAFNRAPIEAPIEAAIELLSGPRPVAWSNKRLGAKFTRSIVELNWVEIVLDDLLCSSGRNATQWRTQSGGIAAQTTTRSTNQRAVLTNIYPMTSRMYSRAYSPNIANSIPASPRSQWF